MVASKTEITEELNEACNQVLQLFEATEEQQLLTRDGEHWSAGEHFQHLVLSMRPLAFAMKLPKLVLRFFGRPKNASKSYDEVVLDYKEKLNKGAKAPFLYTPKGIRKATGKAVLIENWQKATENFFNAIDNWSDQELDRYQLSHPLLGHMTVREMLLFTLYHTRHHFKSMQDTIANVSKAD